MEIFLSILIGISILLIVLSVFFPDRTKEMRKELDDISMKLFQENYQIKKRIKLLEEELLPPKEKPGKMESTYNEIIVRQVKILHDEGLSIPQIAKRSALTENEVIAILSRLKGDGF
jgi:hypothetical protein